MEQVISSTSKVKLFAITIMTFLAVAVVIPATASALTAKFRSLDQGTSSVSCSEAKQSVYHAWGYTVNSGSCQEVNGAHERIWTANYRYDVTKQYEHPWWDPWAPGSYYTTVERTAR
jgi:hypothetical protein